MATPLNAYRLLKKLGAHRRRLALLAQRQRLGRSLAINEERRLGLR